MSQQNPNQNPWGNSQGQNPQPQQYQPTQPVNYQQQPGQPQYPQQGYYRQRPQNAYPQVGHFGGAPVAKKQWPWWATFLLVIAVIVVIGAVATAIKPSTTVSPTTTAIAAQPANNTKAPAQTQKVAPTTTVSTNTIGKIGETQTLNGYLITVNSVQKSDNFSSGDFGKAKDGNTMLAVELTVGSSKDKGVSPNGLSCSLKDSQGFKYDQSIIGYKSPLLPGQNDLPNGDKVRGFVTFEVPKTATGFILEYTPLFESGTARISLGL